MEIKQITPIYQLIKKKTIFQILKIIVIHYNFFVLENVLHIISLIKIINKLSKPDMMSFKLFLLCNRINYKLSAVKDVGIRSIILNNHSSMKFTKRLRYFV